MAKKELSKKQIKQLIKKLKDAKKKKRKTKKDATVSQRVTQKVIIGSNLKDKNDGNAGRSFPVVQFLPQQNMDTQLIRDLLLRSNSSPLTRDVVSRVPYKPSYDTSDQYGLTYNENPFIQPSLGSQSQSQSQEDDNQTEISDISEFPSQSNFSSEYSSEYSSNFDSESSVQDSDLLQLPSQKQGNLDRPIPVPKPINLTQPKITEYYQRGVPTNVQSWLNKNDDDLFTRDTRSFNDDNTTLVRPMDFVKPKNNTITEDKTVNRNKKTKSKRLRKLPDDYSIDSADTIYIPDSEVKSNQKFYL